MIELIKSFLLGIGYALLLPVGFVVLIIATPLLPLILIVDYDVSDSIAVSILAAQGICYATALGHSIRN